MSLTANRSLSVKVKESDKKEDRYEEIINTLFEENGLYRKKLPKDSDSLMRAVSDALYFTTNHHANIQEILFKHLTQLIASDKLTPRLSGFQGNSMMLKDFCNNPQLPGFEKTNLELISLLFKVRVVLYTTSDDHVLTATIFNHNYSNTIELFRTKTSHYNAVFTKNFIEKSGACQNILLNLIDRALNGNSTEWKDLNKDQYVNLTYENSVATAATEAKEKDAAGLDQFRITRGHHKKSLSDNFNTNFEFMEEQHMKFYDAFMSAAPPDDFLKNLNKMRKDTAESGFSINANFDFIDDQALDSPFNGKEFAIKNYPMPSSGLSPRASPLELDSPMPAFSKAKFSNPSNILFNENLTLAEIERLENNLNTATTQDSKQLGVSPFYRDVSPPGLSPTKFSQRSFNDGIQTPKSDLFSPSPVMTRDMQSMSPTYPYSSNSPTKRSQPFQQSYQVQRQFSDSQMQQFAPQSQTLNTQSQAFTLQSQQYNSMYMKRTQSLANSMAMQSQPDAYNMRPQQAGYEQGDEYDYDQDGYGQDFDGMGYNGEFNGMVREKKKPIILDESQERYYGRLKFFDENKKYGFIVMEDDGSDIFVHYDDLCKANITKELLRTARMGNMIRLNFGCMAYIGKYNKSRKAIDIQLVM